MSCALFGILIFFAERELIVNLDTFSREKFPVTAGDFIEVSVPDAEDKTDSKLVQPRSGKGFK